MAEKILVVDDDLDTLRLVGLMLQKQGYQIVAASNGQQGLDLAFSELPNLILLDVMMPQMDGYEVARRLRADEKTADIPILMFTAKSQLDDKVTGFESGADDYLTKPTHPSELHAHVKALLARSSKTRSVNPPTSPIDEKAYSIGILAARGGLGVSTVALNLASTLQYYSKLDVILTDFRPGIGTWDADLSLFRSNGLANLLNTPANELTRDKLKENIIEHASGLKILASSSVPREAPLANNTQHFEVILSRLSFMTRYTVVDLGCGLTSLNQKLLPMFSEAILVAEPFENSLQHTRAMLDNLIELGIEKAKLHVVLNYRQRSESQLSVPQAQDKIKFPVDITFTPAPELMLQAIKMKTTAVIAQPESLTRQQYLSLVSKVMGRVPKTAGQT